mgnify:CR=1 FL=1
MKKRRKKKWKKDKKKGEIKLPWTTLPWKNEIISQSKKSIFKHLPILFENEMTWKRKTFFSFFLTFQWYYEVLWLTMNMILHDQLNNIHFLILILKIEWKFIYHHHEVFFFKKKNKKWSPLINFSTMGISVPKNSKTQISKALVLVLSWGSILIEQQIPLDKSFDANNNNCSWLAVGSGLKHLHLILVKPVYICLVFGFDFGFDFYLVWLIQKIFIFFKKKKENESPGPRHLKDSSPFEYLKGEPNRGSVIRSTRIQY